MNYSNLKSPLVVGTALAVTLSIVSYLYLGDLHKPKGDSQPKDE